MNRQPELRVSLVQAATHWHDPAGNRALYGELMAPLAGQTDLIILTHDTVEGRMRDALALMQALPTVLAPIVNIRKEELS